jgi:hypothetical protein
MTEEAIELLKQIHHTFGLIYENHSFEMTPDEEALFACTLEALFDLLEKHEPNKPAAGAQWPSTVKDRWKSLK